jgi:uncharacterized protein (DUF1330 family)
MIGEYRRTVVESIVSVGGKFAVRGGTLTVLEGEWPDERTVIVEFPFRAMLRGRGAMRPYPRP